jgi:hypothetical protein
MREKNSEIEIKIQSNYKFENEVEYFLVLNEHFQVEV